MITVLPVRDKQDVLAFYREVGAVCHENGGCVCARDGENGPLVGYALYDLSETAMTVRVVAPADQPALADGVLRSALHVAVCHGVIEAFYTDEIDETLLESLQFIEDKPSKKLDIGKLFRRCGSCGEKKT